ncbi:MAG: Rrf2 family transcriptional regulator [Actinomycetota bacterium]|nr:Rrf2 family transcriptional regulator [Actinomycetota bacterium]
MEISAKSDYSIRALVELTAAGGGPCKVSDLAFRQGISPRFLQNLLLQLRRRGLVHSQRGAEGGYRLARPPEVITLADVFCAVDGPLADVRGERPEDLDYPGRAAVLPEMWMAVRVSIRRVLEEVTVADVAARRLSPSVQHLVDAPDAWKSDPDR